MDGFGRRNIGTPGFNVFTRQLFEKPHSAHPIIERHLILPVLGRLLSSGFVVSVSHVKHAQP